MSFELVNVGSGRLATDGECIRDAFVKVNNNFQSLFAVSGLEQLEITVGVNNTIVVSNSINVSNSVGVSIANMVSASNDLDLEFNIQNNLDLSINGGSITLTSDSNNDVVLTSNSFTSTNTIYAPSITSTNNSNNITFNANDIDITNTSGDINIDASTNNVNIIGDVSFNTNMFDINVSTGDINISNGAITIDNSQEVNINNALTIDASNNINIGINNAINIDASQNITFAPSTNIDFTNIVNIDGLSYNDLDDLPVAGPNTLGSLSDVFEDNPNSGDLLIYQDGLGWTGTTQLTSSLSMPGLRMESVLRYTLQTFAPMTIGEGVSIEHDCSQSGGPNFYHRNTSNNFVADFSNVFIDTGTFGYINIFINNEGERDTICTDILVNGHTPKLYWVNGGPPTSGTQGGVDLIQLTILNKSTANQIGGLSQSEIEDNVYIWAEHKTTDGVIPGYTRVADLKTALQDGAGDFAAFKTWALANL